MPFQQLRDLLNRPDFPRFRTAFDEAISGKDFADSLEALRDIGSQAFLVFVEISACVDREMFGWFAGHYERGNIATTPLLLSAMRKLERSLEQEQDRARYAGFDSTTVVIQLKRIVQMSWFGTAGFQASDAFEIRRSVFRSPQERAFARALSLRFPGLHALPNYPLDQVTDLDRLKALVPTDVWHYGRGCRLDALLVTPFEGDPIAAFELDSTFHDRINVAERDRWKNQLLTAAGIPLFRLRSEDPTATSFDEWYSLLTDHVLDKINCGERIRARDIHTSLVPLHR